MTHRPEEKARVQSCNDFLIFSLMVLTSFGAAPLEGTVGLGPAQSLGCALFGGGGGGARAGCGCGRAGAADEIRRWTQMDADGRRIVETGRSVS